MASSVLIEPRPRTRLFRILAWAAAILLIGVAVALAWLYSATRAALPQLDGNLSLPGLTATVTVMRDDLGVPTIEAANLDDLFFAQGYLTAADRLFQMDAMRRYAAGELAEVVGPSALKHDRQQRILGIRIAARKTISTISSADLQRFADYARGVNAYIDSHRQHLPIEFRILGYSPKPWTPQDSSLIGAYMVQDLTTTPEQALVREKILAKLGPELTADLFVNSSWRDRRPTIERPRLDQENAQPDDQDDEDNDNGPDSSVAQLNLQAANSIPQGILAALQPPDAASVFRHAGADFFAHRPPVLGSNNWVVSGAHTVSGKPLLSNDMHLGHQMPNLWFQAHLRCADPACADYNVAGVTLPGYPYVIVGHNAHVAWGFTNLGPTIEDVYVETFNADGQYLTPQGWKIPDHRTETIKVKGGADVSLDIAVTRHGPIVTGLLPGETRQLALRWTLYDGARVPFFNVDSAQNWQQFVQAFSEFDAPGQNVVYADVDGNIGYHATGKIPIRASGDGSLPEDGSNDEHEWTGYIPYDKLPSIFNPGSGIIATANSRITPDKYPYSISTQWEAPWRSARIYRILESGKKFAAADMLSLQADIYSDLDRIFAEKFVYAIDHSQKASVRAKSAADILRQWDGRMTADSAAPTIASQSRRELERLILEPKLGPAPENQEHEEAVLNWKSYHWMMSSVWIEYVVQHQPKRWLPDAYPNYEELLTAAVEAAVTGKDAPENLNTWKWGEVNAVDIQNPVLGEVPALSHWAGPGRHEQSGSHFTVKAVTTKEGPSERMTVDLSDLDHSTLNLVTGEAGNFISPYYMDQWDAWYNNTTFIWPFSDAAVKKASKHRLVMHPGK